MRSALGSLFGHVAGRRVVAAAVTVSAALLASCIVLVQDDTFAVGTESYRANLVVYVETTAALSTVRDEYGTQVARNVVLSQMPSRITLPPAVLGLLCATGPALCVAGDYVPNVVLSWFRSDVRNRGDFGSNLASAAHQRDCFAWTFVPSRNFTEKPVGNSGCRTR